MGLSGLSGVVDAKLVVGQRFLLGRAAIPVVVHETRNLGVDCELRSAGSWCKWYVIGNRVCSYAGEVKGVRMYGETGMTVDHDLTPATLLASL